jgi:hypothetical protein
MKRFFILTIAVFSIIHSGFSQDERDSRIRILFRGLVLDANSFSPVANSQIIINRAFTSVSGVDGTFAFYVSRRDTVVFVSLGYKPTTLYVSDTLSGSEFNAGIYMKSDTLSIGDVVIVPRLNNLKSDMLNSRSRTPSTMDNARYNVAVSAYQGKNSQGRLGDPAANYELLRQKQKVDAFEKGGIPSDKIFGLNPLLIIPAAYLLIHGLPEKPEPMKQELTEQEINEINRRYLETVNKRK